MVERARRRVVGWTLDAGQLGRSAFAQVMADLAGTLLPLLALHRPVGSLRQGLAPLAAPTLPQGRGPDQHRRDH